jgi:hypothetical protein
MRVAVCRKRNCAKEISGRRKRRRKSSEGSREERRQQWLSQAEFTAMHAVRGYSCLYVGIHLFSMEIVGVSRTSLAGAEAAVALIGLSRRSTGMSANALLGR